MTYKKYILKSQYIFLVMLFLRCFYSSLLNIQTGFYPYIKRLINGNYIVLSSTNITFVDNTFSNVINYLNFDENMYQSQESIGSTIVAQFKEEENGYIIAIIKNELYIFSKDGVFLQITSLSNYIKDSQYPCSLITTENIDNDYYFTLIYGSDSGNNNCATCLKINFCKIIFNSSSNTITFDNSGSSSFSTSDINIKDYIGYFNCELMKNNNQEYIACFYVYKENDNYCYVCTLFNVENYGKIQYTITNTTKYAGNIFKAIVLPNAREKALFCGHNSNNGLNCLKYDITSNSFDEFQEPLGSDIKCKNNVGSLIMEYFYETNQLIIGCVGDQTDYYLSQFSDELNFVQLLNNSQIISSENLIRLNIFLPTNQTKYILYAYSSQNSGPKYITLNQEINIINEYTTSVTSSSPASLYCTNYYNYERTECISEIPIGYYCNSTENKTIDKCHENCKTCSEGPSTNNNNCLTCPDSGKEYFNFGNCVYESNCTNGVFTDNSIKRCKCINNIACLLCDSDSTLCKSCNNDEGYYAKSDDTNQYIECYNSKPDNYYLNTATNLYDPCYSKCQSCDELGDDNDNKCTNCKSEYSLIPNNNNIKNCYSTCSNYYYFDANNLICLSEDKCPNNYKLIYSTKRCIDSCRNDIVYYYHFEYNNICYQECPEDTDNSSTDHYLCELNCKKNNKFFSYDQTECLTEIPEKYYCNNNLTNTIEKCHKNCKTCDEGGTDEKNNCKTCPDTDKMYYYLGNCLSESECINDVFIDDNSIKKCKCIDEIKCYYCSSESIQYSLCESCNTNYYQKKDDDTNHGIYINCYNNDTISDGYYLNGQTSLYEPCYSSCKKCNELGDNNNNKCTLCKDGYSFIKNNNNIENCYQNCSHNIYFEDNEYHCTNDDNCPDGYKLINSKKRCIDECENDKVYNYKFKYNNVCYDKCPSNTHNSSENEYLCEDDLICNDYYYSYDHKTCISTIPDGYYCNDTVLKTIDKCHENCKTCDEGGTDENNNCKTCPDTDKMYYYLGNCLSESECINDVFIDDNSIKKCKCIDEIKCYYCSSESIQYSLCESCNTNYYQKKDDDTNHGIYINCYNNDTISDGYYLNGQTSLYEPCYSSCKKCNELGDNNNNKCTLCKDGYSFIKNNNNIENCYQNCSHNIYFEDNEYHCTNDDNCPDGYKLINSKKRCIDECENDKVYNYKFKYNNVCYDKCPSNTHNSSENEYLCEDDLICNDYYYSYDHKTCISTIPDGYYCNDTVLKTIDKCHENCKTCDEGGTDENNNCKACKEGYYQIINDNYINCYNNPEGYYLNNNFYEPCYFSCKKCNVSGNDNDNKCNECIPTHEFKNDFENNQNCYQKCIYNYYYDYNQDYYCTDEDICPLNYSKLIQEKKRCIDDCKKDNIYQYEYHNKCYKKCPTGTKSSINNAYICEDLKPMNEEEKDNCKLEEKELMLLNNDISEMDINDITVEYVNKYGISNDYVYKQENDIYTIYTYKNLSCLKNKANEASQINFGECYDKIKVHYGIIEDLIITIINSKEEKNVNSLIAFYFSNPINGTLLNASKVCADEKIIIQEDVMSLIETLDKEKEKFIIFLTDQKIDVFNLSDSFYNDLCYHFESPNGKDVPIKDRISTFYPNITLCDPRCKNKGVDLETMKAKCECIFNDLMDNNLMDNLYGQTITEVMDLINSLNIAVIKCIKDIIIKEQFIKCIGGFLMLGLLAGEIVCMFKFIFDGLYSIRKYIFFLQESYISYMKNNPITMVNTPPRKRQNKTIKVNINSKYDNYSVQSSKNMIHSKKNLFNKNSKEKINSNNSLQPKKYLKRYSVKPNTFRHLQLNTEKNRENAPKDFNKIKDFLSNSFDENDFDDVLNKEKRSFCQYFSETFKKNQIFINAFFIHEIMRPRALKLLILIITIELYFVINALFYNEEYLSDLFHSTEEEKFFSFVPRRFNEFAYISAVSGIITYLIGYFFIEEEKLKRIFLRNKGDEIKMRYEISIMIKSIGQRFLGLIFFSIFLSIICFVYISCFNIAYPYIKKEWIKSSIFILILMQFLNLLLTFLHSSLRYLSLKYNSEKIFKLGEWLS